MRRRNRSITVVLPQQNKPTKLGFILLKLRFVDPEVGGSSFAISISKSFRNNLRTEIPSSVHRREKHEQIQ